MESLLEPSSDQTTVGLLLIGFLFGLWHAREADHLAAVSAIVSERKSVISASIIGGLWGLGHTISLFVVGALVIFAKFQISESTEGVLEGVVGIMLILLGLHAIRKIFTADEIHTHQHDHGGVEHSHVHTHNRDKAESTSASHHGLSPRSVLVGMVHGLAGSAGLMLLVLPTIPSPMIALVYIAIFGVGSIAGMMLMSVVIGLPLYLTSGTLINKGIRFLAGAFSLVWGAMLVNEKLIQS